MNMKLNEYVKVVIGKADGKLKLFGRILGKCNTFVKEKICKSLVQPIRKLSSNDSGLYQVCMLEDVGGIQTLSAWFVKGCGSSGKSTFMKQVKIINEKAAFREDERKMYKPIICQNIIQATQELICAMERYKFSYESEMTEKCTRMIVDTNSQKVTELDDDLLAAVKQIWNDANIQICYDRRDEFYLLDSTKYYMERLDTIGAADYIPTVDDVVRSRSPTDSIVEYKIPVANYDKSLCIIDVGGQGSERPKWLHCFENCVAFIFISAISEYNQVDETGRNRLVASIALLKILLMSSVFRSTSVVIFLNKEDVFDEKIMKYDLCDYFPEYTGPKQDPQAAKDFFAEKFLECCESEGKDIKNGVYVRCTCATDTENIAAVFSTVRDFIMRKMLQQFNFD